MGVQGISPAWGAGNPLAFPSFPKRWGGYALGDRYPASGDILYRRRERRVGVGVEQMRGGDPCDDPVRGTGNPPVELFSVPIWTISVFAVRAFPFNGYSHWAVH